MSGITPPWTKPTMSLSSEKEHLREAATGLRSTAEAMREDEGSIQLVIELRRKAEEIDRVLEDLETNF